MELEHGAHVHGHGLLGLPHHALGVPLAQLDGLLQRPAGGKIAVQRIVGAGLIGDRVRAHAAAHELRKHLGGVAEKTD